MQIGRPLNFKGPISEDGGKLWAGLLDEEGERGELMLDAVPEAGAGLVLLAQLRVERTGAVNSEEGGGDFVRVFVAEGPGGDNDAR